MNVTHGQQLDNQWSVAGCMKKLTPLANGTDEEGKKNGKLAEGK
jgi:hypothetical protein